MIVTLGYPPSTNRVWRTANGRTYKPAQVRNWMSDSAWRARAAGIRPSDGPVHVAVTLHPRMTKAGQASKRRIDLDNAIKATLDALQGVAFADDQQVIRLAADVGYPMPDGGLTVSVEAL